MTQPAPLLSTQLDPRPVPRSGRRMRAHRLRAGELNLEHMRATAQHAAMGKLSAHVEDLSLTGAALVVHGAAASAGLVLVGDRLEKLRLECREGTIYRGTASVRRVMEREDDLVIGIELESRGIDLGLVYRFGSRHGFADLLSAVLSANETARIFSEFKAWVADFRSYLLTTKAFLDAEERALDGMDLLSREQTLQAYQEEVSPILVERLNAASAELSDFASRLSEDQHSHYRAYFRAHVIPLLCASPLLRRAYEKPLGYAGDYEMMNMLYRDHAEGDSLFSKVINIYAAQEPAARANINRLEYLGARIREMALEKDGRIRIASIGCGPAREITKLLEEQPRLGPRLEIALIDQEDRAITFAERTLGPLAAKHGARVQFIKESVRRLLTTKKLSAALGERDFIYSAGLFDYLNQRSVTALMSALYEALIPGGQLAIGNVAAHNPTRFFMEYALDWFLIHRSPEDLLAFAQALDPTPSRMMVDSEPLGVNLFLRLWK